MIADEHTGNVKKKRVRTEEDKARQKLRRDMPENKSKKSAYLKAYRDNPKNKAKRIAYSKAYYATPEQRARAKERYERPLQAAKAKAYNARSDVKERRRIYYKTYGPMYRCDNPNKFIAKSHLRRARKLNAVVGDTALIMAWEKSWRKAKFVTCFWCSGRVAGKKAHADHIQPLSKGGAHSVENLCISCPSCNLSKQAKPLAEWNQKLSQPVLL